MGQGPSLFRASRISDDSSNNVVVWEVVQAVKIPVIGCGGITCVEDAMKFFIAGAVAVEIGTQNLIDPAVAVNTIKGVKNTYWIAG